LLGLDTTPECPYGIKTYGYGVFMDIVDWTSLVLPSLLVTKLYDFLKDQKSLDNKD